MRHTLTHPGVQVWVGVGGSLSGTSATSTVVDGTLGFSGGVTSLTLVSIKDKGLNALDPADDKNYLGVSASGLTADLVGLEDVLEFHASANLALNKATDALGAPITKLDWDTLDTTGTTGLTLPALTGVTAALDVHLDGTVALNALDGVLVAAGAFSLELGQVSTVAPNNTVSFTNADAAHADAPRGAGVGGGGRQSLGHERHLDGGGWHAWV